MTEATLFDVQLNPSVEEIDEKRLVAHVRRLFSFFRYSHKIGLSVSTLDLMDCAKAQYNARLYELRRALVKQGWCIDEVGRNGAVHYYKLVPNEKSSFYKKLKLKGEV